MQGKSSTKTVCFFYPIFANFNHVLENFLKTLNCSSGHVECSLTTLPENFPPKVRKFFAQNPK